jgi:4-alpha-glucanotransferase
MDATSAQHHLRQLADSYGVEHGYHDDLKRWHDADAESLMAVLRILGAHLHDLGDVEAALRERRQSLWRRPLDPVLVAWDGGAPGALLRLPAHKSTTRLECRIDYESGESKTWPCTANMFHVVEGADVEGVAYEARRLTLPSPLPIGWHKLTVQWQGDKAECTLLSAPTRAYGPDKMMHTWGVFLPLYAMRSTRDWGAGDFTDLGNLIDWVQNQGGGIVGTLPLLAAYMDQPLEPSPYSPASRLFWNELYIDPRQAAEFAAAKGVVNTRSFAVERDALRAAPLVDYKRTAALKRWVLEEMSRTFFAKAGERLPAFQRFTASHPRVEEYARFRAVGEKRRESWWTWPERLRNGLIEAGDYDETARNYHHYVQWLADAQVSALAERAGKRGPGLYLDLPLGVNPDGYDVWSDRESFAVGASAGAPPDSFFTLGQEWGFPPLHPENLRATGYRYLRDVLKHHFQYAGVLRIDHLMGLHRFYWVPRDFGATKGVYVRYPSEELYAVFCLESNRNKCALVGEDLGTVPPEVRPAMAHHNIHRLYLGQFEMKPDRNDPFTWVQGGSVASLNTHDLPTFAAFWNDVDIADRQSQGLIGDEEARREREYRRNLREVVLEKLRQEGRIGDDADPKWVLRACLTHMAQYGEPLFVLSNLEDLWLSNEPQNRPGTTWTQQPNWQTKATHPLEALDGLPGLRETLRALDEAVRSRR